MISNKVRIETIQHCLVQALSPTYLSIIDESHLHVGHIGAQSGGGHFAIEISAACLNNISRVVSHQLIYQALEKLMGTEIHALRIKVVNT